MDLLIRMQHLLNNEQKILKDNTTERNNNNTPFFQFYIIFVINICSEQYLESGHVTPI